MKEITTRHSFRCDLNTGVCEVDLPTPLMHHDALGDVFHTAVWRGSSPADLTGVTVLGYFYAAQTQQTVLLSGSVSGSGVSVTLDAACYASPGPASLVLQLQQGSIRHTVLKVNFIISRSVTDDIIDPGALVPSLPELLAQIKTMEAATDTARQTVEQTKAETTAAVNRATSAAETALLAARETAFASAPPIIPTATGTVVSISDSVQRPLAGLRLYGKTTQNGTPSPDAPAALVSVGAGGSISVKASGKNIFDASPTGTQYIGDCFVNTAEYNFAITPNDTCYAYRVPVAGSKMHVLSTSAPEMLGNVRFEDAAQNPVGGMDWSNLKNKSFTVPAQATFLVLSIEKALADQYFFQIEIGHSATSFELHRDADSLTASTPNGLPGIPVTSGGNYVDSTGQMWLCDEIDFGRGVYVQRVGVRTLNGTETWYTGTTLDGRNNRYTTGVLDKMPELDNATVSRVLCNAYPAIIPNEGYIGTVDYGVQGQNDTTGIIINDARYPNKDLDGFKAALSASPITVMYVLATPTETALSTDEIAAYRAMTTYKPTTTVYNDGGAGLSVDYVADTKAYIDQRIAALLNA